MTTPKLPRPKAPARKPFDPAAEIKATNRQLDKFRDDYQRDRLTLGQNFRRLAASVSELHRRRRRDENRHLDAILEPGALHTVGSSAGTFQKPPTGMSSLDRLRSDVNLQLAPGEAGSIVDPTNAILIHAGNTDPSLGDVGPQPFLYNSWKRLIQNGDFHDPPPDPDSAIDNDTNPLPGWTVVDDAGGSYWMWVADSVSGSGGHIELHLVGASSVALYQDVDIRSTITRNNSVSLVISGSITTGHALQGVTADVLEIDSTDATGALIISSSTLFAADATVQDLTFTATRALTATTAKLRVQIGPATVFGAYVISFYETQLVEGNPITVWPDITDPTNAPATGQYASGTLTIVADAVSIPTLSGFAPSTVDYLVGTATGSLSAEIAVGTTPGGELGGTWASPTVDATHSGSAHSSFQPLDGTLTALAAYNTNGILVQTGADNFLGRSIAVGSGLSISNANGVGGNPNLDRAALTGDVTASAGSNATTLAAGNAGNLNSGTLLAARMPALTGDVTTSAGAVATTIAARAVTAAKLFAASATSKILLRKTAGSGDWEEGSAADLKTIAGYYTSGDSPTFTGTNITGIPESGVTSLTTDLAAKSAVGHGAADHTDITRAIWLYAKDATLDSGTLATLGSAPNQAQVVSLADAATQGCSWTFGTPADHDLTTSYSLVIFWVPGSTDASSHTVRWSTVTKAPANSSDVTAAGTTAAATGSSAARTANNMVQETAIDTTVVPANVGRPVMVNIRRVGADVADTYVGTVHILAVRVTYTATQ